METSPIYASGKQIYPETNYEHDNAPKRITQSEEKIAELQEILEVIADRVANKLLEKAEIADWAKQPAKPLYTAEEVGADAAGNAQKALTSAKQYADKTYVQATGYTDTAIAELINGAQSTIATVKEIKNAMLENESVVDALADAIGTKASDVEAQAHYGNTTVHMTTSERNAWNNKVDSIDGKTLSTNDYTTDEKNKLRDIEEGAERNQTIIPGSNVTITTDASGKITVAAKDTTYTQATSSALGLIKTGFPASGKNYPVALNSSGQAYVQVPWTDTNTTYGIATAAANGLMSATDKKNLDAIIKKVEELNTWKKQELGWYVISAGASGVIDVKGLSAYKTVVVRVGIKTGGHTISQCNISVEHSPVGFSYRDGNGNGWAGSVYRAGDNIDLYLNNVKGWNAKDVEIIDVWYR